MINRSLKVSVLEMYGGTGDPYDYTYSYEQLMYFHGHNAVGKCHLFISTLKKTTREWMGSLSYSDLLTPGRSSKTSSTHASAATGNAEKE